MAGARSPRLSEGHRDLREHPERWGWGKPGARVRWPRSPRSSPAKLLGLSCRPLYKAARTPAPSPCGGHPTMRPVLVLLLLAALCADSARALHCHVCCGHANCESLVECAQTDKYCVITRATNPGGILVMKSCAPTCPNSTVSSDGRALSVFCCQGSQCNRNGAGGLAGGRGALWASAAGSLLWALLWAAW